MRIGVDARELCGHPTGVGRHLAGLLNAWNSNPRAAAHSFVLYAHEPVPEGLLPRAERRLVSGAGGTAWEQFDLPRAIGRDRLDLFFAPGYTAPLSLRVPSVVLVHDLSFATHPEWFRVKEGLRRRFITRQSSKRARLVLAVSESARSEIISQYGLPAARVRCIRPGIASLRRTAASAAREPLVLFVGSVFNRRHIPDLIRAFKPIVLAHPAVRLEIVGDNRTYPHQDLPALVRALALEAHVAISPYADDAGLADLYGRARVFAFLSEYEGFGHPPLEALAAGVPPVLLDTPVAREVCGGAAAYVRLDDPAGTTSALAALLFDDAARARVLEAGPVVLARYSWERAGAETLDALESAANA
jgi:glycosyltransferase involved in cell wall biosynthesis